MIFFYVPQVVANLMIVTSLLYYISVIPPPWFVLTRTLQLGAVSFLACGWMFAGMDPI